MTVRIEHVRGGEIALVRRRPAIDRVVIGQVVLLEDRVGAIGKNAHVDGIILVVQPGGRDAAGRELALIGSGGERVDADRVHIVHALAGEDVGAGRVEAFPQGAVGFPRMADLVRRARGGPVIVAAHDLVHVRRAGGV